MLENLNCTLLKNHIGHTKFVALFTRMGKGEELSLNAGDLIYVAQTEVRPSIAGILLNRFNLTGDVGETDLRPNVCWCWEIYWVGGDEQQGIDHFEIEENIFEAIKQGTAKFYKHKKDEENGERHTG